MRAMSELRLGDAIAGIQVPTLMMVGDRDFLRAANLADAARIPNCGLQVFYRVGHEIAHDVPDEFVAVLDDFVQHGVAAADSLAARAEAMRALAAART
jgi:pimeloyl-ACP methyl ester carboxylesterase